MHIKLQANEFNCTMSRNKQNNKRTRRLHCEPGRISNQPMCTYENIAHDDLNTCPKHKTDRSRRSYPGSYTYWITFMTIVFQYDVPSIEKRFNGFFFLFYFVGFFSNIQFNSIGLLMIKVVIVLNFVFFFCLSLKLN